MQIRRLDAQSVRRRRRRRRKCNDTTPILILRGSHRARLCTNPPYRPSFGHILYLFAKLEVGTFSR